MKILYEYAMGEFKKNKAKYKITTVTIFIAVLILTTLLFGISSYFKSYSDMPNNYKGNSHLNITSAIPIKKASKLKLNRNIAKVGFYNIEQLDYNLYSNKESLLYKMDTNAIKTMKKSLVKGELPSENEILISQEMSKQKNKNQDDSIKINNQIFKVSGIYDYPVQENNENNILYTTTNQENILQNENNTSVFLWFKNIFMTYSYGSLLIENLEMKNISYDYNDLLLNRSFVFNPENDLLRDYVGHFLVIVVVIILLILFYSIIRNVFSVQESKSMKEYSKLRALGASTKDIKKLIKFKILYISFLPILLGIIVGIVLIAAIFLIFSSIDKYVFNNNDVYSIFMYLKMRLDFKLMVFIYLLSTMIIYLAMIKPMRFIQKTSILNGMRGLHANKKTKKYDLIPTDNIVKDLSNHFYKNSKKSFVFSNNTLKIGFCLMLFVMMAITFYSMNQKYNKVSSFNYYDIQAKYETNKPLKKNHLKNIEKMNIKDMVSFRKESVYLKYNKTDISKEYIDSNSLENLRDKLSGLENIKVEIFGVDDKMFYELASKKGIKYQRQSKNKVILLNTMGDKFNIPISKMKDRVFFKDNVNNISLYEDINLVDIVGNKGYEFNFDTTNKIDTPLFDYPIEKKGLNVYMPKSEYVKLFKNFSMVSSMDQYEYISIKTNDIKESQTKLTSISSKFINKNSVSIESVFDENTSVLKRNIMGSILVVSMSLFFLIVGFSNSYFSLYNIFINRENELLIYKSIGLDNTLLYEVLRKEKYRIALNLIIYLPVLIVILAIVIAKITVIFNPIELLINMNIIFLMIILLYILLIYRSITLMYNNFSKHIK